MVKENQVKTINKSGRFFLLLCLVAAFALAGSNSFAADSTVAIVNMQKVLINSKAGKEAQKVLETKVKELQTTFKKDEDNLIALQKEIEKKSTVWSDEVKQEKAIEFQKQRRDLRVKQEDANLEMKRLREQQLNPIWKVLEQVVTDVAKKKGYKVVMPRTSVFFASADVDITDEVVTALDAGKK